MAQHTPISLFCYSRKQRNILPYSIITLFFFSLFTYTPCLAINYCVDATNGSDNNSGECASNSPWKSVAKVNNGTFAAGDKILFKRGEIWHELLIIPSSGIAGQPITFGAYGSGNRPMFDGTYSSSQIPVEWVQVQGNIYKTSQPPWHHHPGLIMYKGKSNPAISTLQFAGLPSEHIKKGSILLQKDNHYSNLWVSSKSGHTISGITFFKIYENENIYARYLEGSGHEIDLPGTLGYPTIIKNQTGLTEPGHWYWDNNEIYLYSDTDPNNLDIKIAHLPTGIHTAMHDHLIIQDIAVQGFKDTGVLIAGTEGSTVQNLHIQNIGAASPYKTGLLIHNSKNNIVQNNVVESTLATGIAIFAVNGQPFSQYNIVKNNSVRNSGGSGISLSSDGQAYTVTNNEVTGNSVSNANSLTYDSAGIYTLFIGQGNIISANTIVNGGSNELRSSGIMIEGGTDPSISPVTIDNNTITSNSMAGIAVSGKGHLITNNILRNNGLSSWDSGQLLFFASFGTNAADCTVNNNTMEATENRTLVSVLNGYGHTSSPPHHINNNKYCSTNSTPFCWSGGWTCNNSITFNSWKSASGHDTSSSFVHGTCFLKPTLSGIYLLLLE